MGTREEFEPWARTATPKLFHRALMLTCGDRHKAEDLVQDALTKLYIAWHRVDQDRNVTAYAQTTLYRLFVSQGRRMSSKELTTPQLPEKATHDIDPSSSIDLSRALATLQPHERALVVARYADDLPVAKVATQFGKSEAWVRKTSQRTLERLRHCPQLALALQE